ncbi:LysM peptidoglycan-binding domain-containing protein [Brevibacillus sp. 179-C9.3 HS]|uniref:LysM peptidoglycan-binding domain-containing protein n=1 Tax=unclassified Brevibacillus TaxID=2684853 RepID=UPI0039A104C3
MNLEQNPLPPRRSRHTRPKASFSIKKWIQPGLLLFGFVFFGLIGLELYRANAPHESAASGTVEFNEVGKSNVAANTQGKNAGEKEPASVVLPSTPDPNASVDNTPAKTKTTESNQAEPVVKATASTEKPAMSQTTSTAPTGTNVNKTSQTAKSSSSKEATPGKQATMTPSAKAKVVKHVVKKGETLFMLSRQYYGNNSNVARIAKYNGLHAESGLTEGKVVLVPLTQ